MNLHFDVNHPVLPIRLLGMSNSDKFQTHLFADFSHHSKPSFIFEAE